jgi:hypothetical protein
MKRYFLLFFVVAFAYANYSCSSEKETWQPLFNGQDLSNWDIFLGSSLGADFDDLAASATPDQVYAVVDKDGEKIIRISGEINGSLATKESFENYHLRLVFRWGEEVHSRRNSGLLYHSFGDFGAAFGTWMPNIEMQMMHQNLGDTYLMVNTTCETSVVLNADNNQYFFEPGAEVLTFGDHANGRMIRKGADHENPLGEWNTIELYCYGQTAVHVVNGITVMVNTNTGTFENDVINPLTSGKIQIQSEGAELFVRSVEIRTIDGLPEDILP